MSSRHANIPIFVPHLGCPNDCVFCDQRAITGKTSFCIGEVESGIEKALSTLSADDVQIAFFGGSFTGIERDDMIALLSIAKKYIDTGKVRSVRLSTRPDYIDEEILDILASYGVTDIELGIQSMSENVLEACRRGHHVEDSISACKLIKSEKYSFNLVGQMMVGLPSATSEDEIMTAKMLCSLGIDAARVYPTVVLAKTELAEMMMRGDYLPLSVEEGAKRAAAVLEVLSEAGIPCIRCGLCATDDLSDKSHVLAGAYHPAMGELSQNALFLERIIKELDRLEPGSFSGVTIYVARGCVSKASGQGKRNKIAISEKYKILPGRVFIKEDETLHGYDVRTETTKKEKVSGE